MKTEIVKEAKYEKPVHKKTFDGKSRIYNITVENISASGVELPVIVAGYRQKLVTGYCTDVTLRNFGFTCRDAAEIKDRRLFIPEYARAYPERWRFRNLPTYGIWARHCRNLRSESFVCKGTEGSNRKEKILIDCK